MSEDLFLHAHAGMQVAAQRAMGVTEGMDWHCQKIHNGPIALGVAVRTHRVAEPGQHWKAFVFVCA